MLWQFSVVSFVDVSEGCFMVSVTLFEACCKAHVWFCCCVGCYDCLVDYVRFEAFSFKGAFVFCSAVALVVGLLRWSWGVIWEECFVVCRDNGFHVWHARVATFERVPVEDLVKRWSSMGGCTKWCFFGDFPCGFSSVFGWFVGCMLICRCIRFHQVLFGTGGWLRRKLLRWMRCSSVSC